MLINGRLTRLTRFLKTILRTTNGKISFTTSAPMRFLCLYAHVRISSTVTRGIRYLFTCLLHVIPEFRRATLTRVVPSIVRFLRRFIDVLSQFPIIIRFKRKDHFRRFRSGRKIVNDRTTSHLNGSVKVERPIFINGVSRDQRRVISVFLSKVISKTFTA